MNKLYYECHITIEPIFDEHLEKVSTIARTFNFRVADLLMKKRKDDIEERSKNDTFMTSHSKNYNDLKFRMISLINVLKIKKYKIWRYKIENVILDSKFEDKYKLL